MNKFILNLLFCFTFLTVSSQISFSPKEYGKKPGKFDKGVIKNFKSSTTIFVLSDYYSKVQYEDLLNKYWTVTPYRVVSHEDFALLDYAQGNYSFAKLEGYVSIVTRSDRPQNSGTRYLHTYIGIRMYDFKKLVPKLNPKKKISNEKFQYILRRYTEKIARVEMFPSSEFIIATLTEKPDELFNRVITGNVFHNYSLGYLKNYIQKLNQLLVDEVEYGLYESKYLSELKDIAESTLYVPKYVLIKFKAFTGKEEVQDEEAEESLFKDYTYDYKIVEDEEIDRMILNDDSFYYLRYTRANSSKFIEVVNAKTGEVVYRDYIPGLSYNIKTKNIKELNSKIQKTLKN